jgi:DNA-binding response OmpR family regulator
MPRILSVSYDEMLLKTRADLLEHEGYEVVSVQGFIASLEECKHDGFDLFILGHSIPHKEKQELIRAFRRSCSAPIVSLLRNCDDSVDEADLQVEPDPRKVLDAVAAIVRKQRGVVAAILRKRGGAKTIGI